MTYHVARDGEILGEFSQEAFRSLCTSGQILPTDHYWSEGMTEWKTVDEYRSVAKTQRIMIAPELPPPAAIVIAKTATPPPSQPPPASMPGARAAEWP